MQSNTRPDGIVVTADHVAELKATDPTSDAWLIFDGTRTRITESSYDLAGVVEIASRNTLVDLINARAENKDPVDDEHLAADLAEIGSVHQAAWPWLAGQLPSVEKLGRMLAAQSIVRCGPPVAMTTAGERTALLQAYGVLGHDHAITRRHAHPVPRSRGRAVHRR